MNVTEKEQCHLNFTHREDGYSMGVVALNGLVVLVGLIFTFSTGIIWGKRFHDEDYLRVRSNGSQVIFSWGFVSYLLALPTWRATLQGDSSFNRCEYNAFFLLAAINFFLAGVFRLYLEFYLKHQLLGTVISFVNNGYISSVKDVRVVKENLEEKFMRITSRYRFYSSVDFRVGFTLALVLVMFFFSGIEVMLVCPNFGIAKASCEEFRFYALLRRLTGIGYVIASIFIGFVYIKSRKFPDPFYLLHQVTICLVIGGIFLGLNAFATSSGDTGEKDLFPNGDNLLFLDIYFWVMYLYMVPFQLIQSRRLQLKLGLKELLKHPMFQKLFTQHLHKEVAWSYLSCYFAIQQWKHDKSIYSHSNFAKNIYNSYIKEDNVGQVFLSPATLEAISRDISTNNIHDSIFDRVEQEVFDSIESDNFQRFKDEGFYNFYLGIDHNMKRVRLFRSL